MNTEATQTTVKLKGYEMLTKAQYRAKMALCCNGSLTFAGRDETDSYDLYNVLNESALTVCSEWYLLVD